MPTPLSRDPRRAARERSTTSTESDPRAPSSTKGLEPTTPPDSTTASKTKVRQRPPRRPQTHFPPPRASAPAIPRLNQRSERRQPSVATCQRGLEALTSNGADPGVAGALGRGARGHD